MPRCVAFLRAVNVGGRVVKMDALRRIFESMGLAEVETFIASGNVLFSSKGVRGLDAKIAAGLEKALSYEVPTFVRTVDEVATAALHVPFPDRDAARFPMYLVGFLSKPLDAAGVERLSLLSTSDDRFHVLGRDFWWLSKHHQARPAITGRQLEKALGQPTTLRNVNTIVRIAEKFSEICFFIVKTDVVLLPGMHGSTALYDAFSALAPAWARCVPVALPTLGDQSIPGLAATLEAELRHLEEFVLVAESYSGPIAVRLAARLGPKVTLLVLCNPLVEMAMGLPAGLAASAARWQGMPAWTAAAVLAGGDRALGKAALDGIRALPREVLEARLASAFAATADELSPLLSAPLLAVLGTKDRLVSSAKTRALLKGVPFSTVVELDAPHLVVQTRPAEVWAAISGEFESAA